MLLSLSEVNEQILIIKEEYRGRGFGRQAMRDNEEYREKFIGRCRKRIESDFPDFRYVIEAIENVK